MLIDNKIYLKSRYCFEPPLFSAKLQSRSGSNLELESIDLNEFFSTEKHNYCLVKINSNNFADEGIRVNDLIIVDFDKKESNSDLYIVKIYNKLKLAKMFIENNKKYFLLDGKKRVYSKRKITGSVSHIIKNAI